MSGDRIMSVEEAFLIGMKRNIKLYKMDGPVILNLGAGEQKIPNAINYDLPDWDASKDIIPKDDNSVNSIHAHHLLEHLSGEEAIAFLIECQRVLVPGGKMLVTVPYYKSDLAHQNLDHKSFWDLETLKDLFDNDYYDKRIIFNRSEWKLEVLASFIIGITTRNIALIYQLVKRLEIGSGMERPVPK